MWNSPGLYKMFLIFGPTHRLACGHVFVGVLSANPRSSPIESFETSTFPIAPGFLLATFALITQDVASRCSSSYSQRSKPERVSSKQPRMRIKP